MEQQYSYVFVVLMGMGVTFIGLTSIIFLTLLMGRIMTAVGKRRQRAAPPPAPIVPAAGRFEPADGCGSEVKVAILAALAQQPGFQMENVVNIQIRKCR